MEAYSKARTSDAITALANLRPVEAQLVVPASSADPFQEKPTNYDPEKADSETELSGSLGVRIVKTNPELLEVGDTASWNLTDIPYGYSVYGPLIYNPLEDVCTHT